MRWSVMIFAAGFGTRMKHLTRDKPKPLVEVNGAPLIDHALGLTTDLPAAKVVANLHYKPDALRAHLHAQGVHTLLETPEILDTGGGLRNALPVLGASPVMTLNSDAIWCGRNPLKALATAWDPDKMDGLLMCIPPKKAVGYNGPGNFVIDTAGRITRGPGAVYGGAQIIKTDRLREIGSNVFSLNVLWDMLIAESRLYAVEYGDAWCDVGHPDGVAQATKLLRAQHV
ncbi:MAG: nucleotidyltransferase family protein [Roseobacter sp.]